jgi:hypothetical protein
MLRPIVPATASTNTQNALCLSHPLSLSVFIFIETSRFVQNLQPLFKGVQSLASLNQTAVNFRYARLIPKSHKSYRRGEKLTTFSQCELGALGTPPYRSGSLITLGREKYFDYYGVVSSKKVCWRWDFATASASIVQLDAPGYSPVTTVSCLARASSCFSDLEYTNS